MFHCIGCSKQGADEGDEQVRQTGTEGGTPATNQAVKSLTSQVCYPFSLFIFTYDTLLLHPFSIFMKITYKIKEPTCLVGSLPVPLFIVAYHFNFLNIWIDIVGDFY